MTAAATAAAARQAARRLLWPLPAGAVARRGAATAAGGAAGAAEEWPVVIAGGGPTGLTAAILLSKYGVPCLVLERAQQLTDHPQAHFINMRAMEVFRGLDGLSHSVTKLVPPLQQWRRFVYCDTMTGNLLGQVDHFKGQTTPYMPSISPEPVAHLAQNRLLPLMWQRAAARPSITLRMGHRLEGFEQGEDGVRATVVGEQGERYTVESPYLLAADGARGATRTALGIDMEGPGGIQHLINVHFTSPELGRLVKGREGMLYFVFGTNTIAVVVAHNIDAGEFVAQVPYFPPLQRPEDFTPAACTDLMRRMAGQPNLQLQVKTIRPWTMSGRVASSYQKGRVFLVGDAAHHFPPSGAFGMNTGVCDAHNLAWKLAAVLEGTAGPRLLESYTPERKPVGLANMQLSADNFFEELKVPSTIGLDYSAANTVSDVLSAPALSFIPTGLRRAALDGAFSLGMAASGALRRLRRGALDSIFASGETLRLQFPKEDLGFVYHHDGAAVARTEEDRAAVRAYLRPRAREAPYEPCTLAGARMPHVALSLTQPGSLDVEAAGGTAACTSTLDLITASGTGLTLFLSDSPALPDWLSAAARSVAETGVPIHPIVIVSRGGGSGALAANERAAQASVEAGPGVAVALDSEGAWESLRGVGPEGGLLVRPDGHVGWRCGGGGERPGQRGQHGGMVAMQSQLSDAVRAVMGYTGPRVMYT